MNSPAYSTATLINRLEQKAAEAVGNNRDRQAHYMTGWLAEALVTILRNQKANVDNLLDLATNDEVAA